MKPAILPINLSFLLVAVFSTKLSLASDTEQVLDANGDPIFPGGQYYIVSAIWGAGGGGVRPGRTGNSTYPTSVIQEISDLKNGVPVNFSIPGTSTGIIFTGTPLEIEFTRKPHRAESGKWVVVTDSKTSWVGIGGPEDHPGKELRHGFFKIEKSTWGFAYKLVFSPTITTLSGRSFDIGRETVDGKRLLVLNEDPFQVVFVNANVDGAGKSII